MTLSVEDKKRFFSLLDKTINFLSYRLRSKKEVSDRLDTYLYRLKISEDEKQSLKVQVLDELANMNLLNDEVFTETYLQQMFQSKKAVNKNSISNYLYKKGISKSIIADAISKFGKVAEKESAERTADKKLRTLAKYDAKIAKNKLTVYLLGKGYSPDVVYSLVDTKFKKK